jgi:hypothetical protein
MKKLIYAISLLILGVLVSCSGSHKQKGLVYFNDFEDSKGWNPFMNLTRFPAHSGGFSVKMDSVHVYGPTLRVRLNEISLLPIRKLKYSFWCFQKSTQAKAKFVVSIEDPGNKTLLWEGKDFKDLTTVIGKWVEIKGECNLVKDKSNDGINTVSIYPWNVSKEEIDIDDFRVEFVL